PVQAIVADTKNNKNPEAEINDHQPEALDAVAEKTVSETLDVSAPLVAQGTEEASTVDVESKAPSLEELFPKASLREKGDARRSRNAKEVKSEANTDAAVSEVAVQATAKTNEDLTSSIKSHRGDDQGQEAEVQDIGDEPKLNRRAERLASRARNDERSDAVDNSASRSESSRDVPAILDRAAFAVDQAAPIEVSDATASPATPTIPTTTSSVTPVPVASPPSNVADVARGANAPGNTADRGTSLAGIASTNTSSSSTSGSRAESARGSIPTSLSRYQETKLVQRVLRGIEQLSNGGGQVRLRLHPQELGTLQMTLRIEGSQMSAKLEVENSTAKEALLQNLQGLKDRLADQGMQVERFEVTVSSQSNSFGADAGLANGNQDRRSWEQQATSRYATQNNNLISPERPAASAEPARAWSRTNGSLDVKV
ncbi:MAG: flagellar hook-length control protein FliK, partial [Planctomycetes bacterium]|nr:flagellar hook-length control protein FliK [Planctomycetota bacterium]